MPVTYSKCLHGSDNTNSYWVGHNWSGMRGVELMNVQMIRNSNAIVLALAGLLLFVSPQSSLSEEPGQPQPLGQLPTVRIPSHNLQFDEKVSLGKLLFFDSRLSKDGSVSCASCHVPAAGFSDPRPVSLGLGGKQGW